MAKTDNTMKTMISMFSVIIMMAVLSAVVTGIPTPPPPVKYVCPIDGLEFNSLAELEAHFAEAHPTTPIDIVWD